MVKERRDILARILERLREVQPTITEEVALQIEQQLRQEYAGTEVYIQKKSSIERRKKVERMFDGRNVEEVAQSMGVSRSTVYRVLKKR